MSISSIANTNWYHMLPPSSSATGTSSHSNPEQRKDPIQFSPQARELQKAQIVSNSAAGKDNKDTGKEFVQVSSSIGRSSRITGLNRDEVAALYRSIDQLS